LGRQEERRAMEQGRRMGQGARAQQQAANIGMALARGDLQRFQGLRTLRGWIRAGGKQPLAEFGSVPVHGDMEQAVTAGCARVGIRAILQKFVGLFQVAENDRAEQIRYLDGHGVSQFIRLGSMILTF
jgi:hypothetical protein